VKFFYRSAKQNHPNVPSVEIPVFDCRGAYRSIRGFEKYFQGITHLKLTVHARDD
jgi:hypothetical protein